MKTFRIIRPDENIRPALIDKINNLTKPKGSLGTLEDLALQIGWIQQTLSPTLQHPQNIIFAADHGIVDEGVSLSPKEVTWQQISNFLHGGAGVNFLCRQHGFTLKIVDAGVDYNLPYDTGIIDMKVRKSTRKAAELFLEKHPEASSFKVTLYGSLAATGKGHMTNIAITDTLQPAAPVEIIWEPKIFLPFHPNGMKFVSVDASGNETDSWTVFSVGGGALAEENDGASSVNTPDIYSMNHMTEILQWCEKTGKSYWEYVKECEEEDIWDYLQEVWKTMQAAVRRGLEQEGVLPGPLNLRRKASTYYIRASGYKQSLQSRGLVFAYALAVSEENASGGTIVTAPTCGSCGVMPAVLYHLAKSRDFSDIRILRALATAGLVGNIVKTNASISGAEVGCQGEVGVACAMASAAANQLFGGSPAQIEYAAEMGLEHHLGMTCDPVCGLVQIPCIERNAYAAARALDANLYSSFTDGMHRVSFDKVVEVMKETGNDLPSLYKETSEGGLAKDYRPM